MTGPDLDGSLLGDGIANVAVLSDPEGPTQGPFEDPAARRHGVETNEFLTSSEFCGTCHDVRLPFDDVVADEPFQRLENLFTEWENSPYNVPGDPQATTTCQDCHMSEFPEKPPGTYERRKVAESGVVDRKHANHEFTAVSVPLSAEFAPYVDKAEAKRQAMLQAACELSLDGTRKLRAGEGTLEIAVEIENVGAGHNVPSGFSQEREVWVEIVVQDEQGTLFERGVVGDTEDLAHRKWTLDPDRADELFYDVEDGDEPDLLVFTNDFAWVEGGETTPVFLPIHANHMDNGRSIPPLESRERSWTVQLEREPVGDVTVSARLLYRAFPPKLLKLLAEQQPDLVDDAVVAGNTVVVMAQDEFTVKYVR